MAGVESEVETWRVGVEAGEGIVTGLDPQGNPTGFGPALMFAVGKEMNLRIEWVVKPWHVLLAEMRAGRLDVLSAMAYTPERDAFVDYTTTILELRPGAFGRKGVKHPVSIHDLKGLRLAVQRDSYFEDYLRSIGIEGEFVYANSVGDRLAAVKDGKADIAFVAYGLRNADVSVVSPTDRQDLEPIALEFPGINYRLFFGVRENDKRRLAILNEGLVRIRDSGTYSEVYEKWIGPLQQRKLQFRDVWRAVLPFALLAVAGIVIALWQRHMMRRLGVHTAALRESEEKLSLVLEAGDHGYWQANFETGVVERSESAVTMLGYSFGEMAPTVDGWLSVVHPEDVAIAHQSRVHALAAGRRSYSFEYRVRAKNGNWQWIQVKGKILELTESGAARRAAGTSTDITEMKSAEFERAEMHAKLLETQRLESVGLLAGGVAHDFNNLLTVIIGSIGLARMDLPEEPGLHKHLDQIEAASRRAANMCRQLLACAGRAAINFEAVDLNGAVADTLQLLKASVPGSAEVVFDLHPHLPPIEADSTQIRQIIMNLVINAAEALDGNKGKITLGTKLVSPTVQPGERIVLAPPSATGPVVCFAITDSGSGMSNEVIRRVFEPFFTTKFTGRGLGLAATIGLVRSFGGGIFLASTEGQGTCFRLFFPTSTRGDQTKEREIPHAVTSEADTGARILVVDDEPAVLAVAASILTSAGFSVVRSRDGFEALEKFRVAPDSFDAALLDLTMPDKDGAALLAELREIRPDLRVLMMSGFGPEHVMSRLPKNNPPTLLRKPFTGDELVMGIQKLLRQ